jgi:cbb3-type cytochrome oxidase maturation protein
VEILFFLIPLSMIVLGVAIAAFFWAVKSGQYDDLEGPAYRILMDDDDPRIPVRAAQPRKPPGPGDRATGGSARQVVRHSETTANESIQKHERSR